MEEFKSILKNELEKFTSANPGNEDGTVSGMLDRLNYVKDNIPKITKRLNELTEDYGRDNNLSKDEQQKINEITLDTFNDFVQSFAK